MDTAKESADTPKEISMSLMNTAFLDTFIP